MRNLKKVLALALATVMLLGMMAMASAADFNDEALIADQYDAAVDVMQAIGVFNGSKGYLNPKNTLTRAEAAKIITYLALTKANADKLGAAEAPFADVEADNWAAGSIAYAKNLGIVSGKGENKFDPAGTLTGYEFGKMLLVVLGYQGNTYKGAGWDTNVNLDAMNAGLLKGLSIDLGANILREEAAQMAYNALTAQCVAFTGGTVLETGDTKITVGAVKTELKDDNYASYLTTGTKDGKLQLAEKLYPTLKLNEDTESAFGYATKTWYFGTPAKAVATVKNATVLASYAGTANTAATDKALYAAIGSTAATETISVYENGTDTTVDIVVDKTTATVDAQIANYKGATVELVKDGTEYKLLVSYAYPAQVKSVTEAKGETKRSVELYVYNNGEVDSVTYTTENYAKGDWLLVYPGDKIATTASWTAGNFEATGEILKVEAAATTYGTLTQKTESGSAVTALYLDGVAIPVAHTNFANLAADKSADATVSAKYAVATKYNVIMMNGYAVAAATDAAVATTMDSIYYIDKVAASATVNTTAYGAAQYYEASVIKMDGTIATVKLDVTDPDAPTPAVYAGHIYKMVDTDKDGIFENGNSELTAVLDATYNATTMPFVAEDVTTAISLKATDKSVTVDNKAYFTAASKIMFVSGHGTAKVATEIVAAPMATTLPVGAQVIYSTNTTANVKEVAMIIVEAAKSTNAADMYYVINTDIGDVRIGTTTYNQINVYSVATGAKSTVAVTAMPGFTGFASYKVNADGAYTFVDETINLSAKLKAVDAKVSLYNGMLNAGVNVVDVAYDTAVVINLKSTAALTIGDLAAKANVEATAYVSDGKLLAIVVTDWTDA